MTNEKMESVLNNVESLTNSNNPANEVKLKDFLDKLNKMNLGGGSSTLGNKLPFSDSSNESMSSQNRPMNPMLLLQQQQLQQQQQQESLKETSKISMVKKLPNVKTLEEIENELLNNGSSSNNKNQPMLNRAQNINMKNNNIPSKAG